MHVCMKMGVGSRYRQLTGEGDLKMHADNSSAEQVYVLHLQSGSQNAGNGGENEMWSNRPLFNHYKGFFCRCGK